MTPRIDPTQFLLATLVVSGVWGAVLFLGHAIRILRQGEVSAVVAGAVLALSISVFVAVGILRWIGRTVLGILLTVYVAGALVLLGACIAALVTAPNDRVRPRI